MKRRDIIYLVNWRDVRCIASCWLIYHKFDLQHQGFLYFHWHFVFFSQWWLLHITYYKAINALNETRLYLQRLVLLHLWPCLWYMILWELLWANVRYLSNIWDIFTTRYYTFPRYVASHVIDLSNWAFPIKSEACKSKSSWAPELRGGGSSICSAQYPLRGSKDH